MPTEVVILELCDPCFKRGERTEGTPFTGLLDGMRKPRKMLLCEIHYKEFVEPLRELMAKMGTPVEEPVAKSAGPSAGPAAAPSTSAPEKASPRKAGGVRVATATLECPVEGCHHEGTKSNIRDHTLAEHSLGIAQAAFQNGTTMEGKEIRFVCRDGDCRKHPSGFAVGAAVTQHVMRAHGHRGSLDTSKYAV